MHERVDDGRRGFKARVLHGRVSDGYRNARNSTSYGNTETSMYRTVFYLYRGRASITKCLA